MASGMGMQCLPMAHKIIMQAIVSYPLHTHHEHDENEILKKNEIKHMYNETIQPPETNDTIFLLGAEFARGRVC